MAVTSAYAPLARPRASRSDDRRRTYVLDTSVLLADPRAVLRFDEHEVVLPIVVLMELEAKRDHPELGWAARRALRLLEDLRLEHGTVTVYLTGVSRSLTHELVRHRHFSYSQLSQRYVPEGDAAMIEPDVIADDPQLHAKFVAATEASQRAYRELLDGLEERYAGTPEATLRRKQARQAARSVLPNATETKITVTANARALRHFIEMRASRHAEVEIRKLAVAVLRLMQGEAPNLFGDYQLVPLDDGTFEANTSHRKV